MFSTADTIVAIATPHGRGGIGVVRISGREAQAIARRLIGRDLRPRHATFARTRDDQVVATSFPAPHSYTGEHVVEISAHGSPVVLRDIVQQAINAGARLAEPGEFTLRAFLNGRIDLVQAEAVADVIDAVTPLQARAAFDQLEGTLTGRIAAFDAELFDLVARLEASLDFSDEGYHFVGPDEVVGALGRLQSGISALLADARRGRLIREGARVAIFGKPNVGKSSLFNALVGAGRAIVTAVAGTTRDLVVESTDIAGVRLELVDTAGLRETTHDVEREGVRRARQASETADLLVVVLDGSQPIDGLDRKVLEETSARRRLVVANKSDLPSCWGESERQCADLFASALTGEGIEELRGMLLQHLVDDRAPVPRDVPAVTNIRHAALLDRAHAAVVRAREAVADPHEPVPEEFVLSDLEEARAALEEITGKRSSDDLLRHIFARFCVGK